MPPSSAIRSFTIVLAIVIAIIEPPASGYAIHRDTAEPPRSSDLVTENSIQLQVRHGSIIENHVKGEKEIHVNKSNNKYSSVDYKNNITEKITNKIEVETTTELVQTTTEGAKFTENVRVPTISSDTIEVFDSSEEITENSKTERSTDTHPLSTNYTDVIYTTQISSKKEDTPLNISTITLTEKFDVTTTSPLTSTGRFSTESENTPKNLTKQDVATVVPDSDKLTTTTNNDVITATDTKNDSDTTIHFDSTLDLTTLKIDSTITDDLITRTDSITTLARENDTDVPTEVTTLSFENIIETTEAKTTTAYPRKKYTTIERNRSTSGEDIMSNTMTTTIYETMKAETSNSNANFEKAFSITPIPSLEKLRVDLLSQTNTTNKKEQVVTDGTEKVTQAVESTIPSINTISDNTKRPATVETKRGGFINFSEKTITAPMRATETITTDVFTISEESHMPTIETNKTPIRIEKPQVDKASESQGQLTEDAIREEQLLKEKNLSNHYENIKRYGDDSDEKRVQPLVTDTPSEDVGTLSAGDSLSVQPINYERTKTTLYTLSPNYKPMKKLEVQPAKPFIRDPDDNSWRNESISSLGIVFNPKNSSKSFKEVLKNKTQIELNNLQEKDNKDDLPDLRVRLEKIAEVRKTKKKKTNKNGEVVYTDYEEVSVENSRDTTTSATDLPKLEIPVLTSPKPLISELEFNYTSPITPASVKKDKPSHALFENEDVETLTTEKPKTLFNIAEYYDTTDEYDADYVTMSKIDLKKHFAATPRTTDKPASTPARPSPSSTVRPYFPDRKPTVQYFPPRTTQKVNFNNLDVNFERKVNLYNFKEFLSQGEREERLPPFATVPPPTVATDKPEMRPTVRPSEPTAPPATYVMSDGGFDRGSYVIKHYKDFLDAAKKDDDEPDFVPYTSTEPPLDALYKKDKDPDYDYDRQFRKEVLNRFVDNFNQNSERFKVDFPILYNSSVVHWQDDANGRAVASSRAFLKRLYGAAAGAGAAAGGTATMPIDAIMRKPCAPSCDVTVELSPAYELHYYVPDQEEKEEVAPYRPRV